jgi:Uma2 family endonuclease
MAKELEHEEAYYYDLHPTEEDLMGESSLHADLVSYLMAVLHWQFHDQVCAIYENLNFYQTTDRMEYPMAPDIAVIKGVERRQVISWKIGPGRPAPQVVFEFASKETWDNDLDKKPHSYGLMGVKEYFAYDPNLPPLSRNSSQRLWGWQLVKGNHKMRPLSLRPDGSLWSQYLESSLVPDGQYLRLYDSNGHLRLTRAEAEAEARQAEARRAEMEAEARRAAEKRAEMLAEKLRSLGIDPDQV